MFSQAMVRDWAHRLILSEAKADQSCAHPENATYRVYEMLRRRLCAPVGADGFQALACRALSLAKSQSTGLSGVQVTASGDLSGLDGPGSEVGTEEADEVGIILIAQLLGLFLTLLGEVATVRLIEHVPPRLDVAKAETTRTTRLGLEANYLGPFDGILLEADQLRKVSERLESLADQHADIAEVMSVAGSIRNIAAVLDVFTLVRSKAGGPRDDLPNPFPNGYLN